MLHKKQRVPLQSFPRNIKVAIRTKNFAAKIISNNILNNRLGVIIGKRVGSATERNKLKRIIMTFFSNQKGFMEQPTSNGRDVVIIVAAGAATHSIQELKKELEKYERIF